jgi:hypothetical protein
MIINTDNMEVIMICSGSKKMCATCGSWSGQRELAQGNLHVKLSAGTGSKGKCLDKKSRYGIEVIWQGTCQQWQKWSPLR